VRLGLRLFYVRRDGGSFMCAMPSTLTVDS
jgi:hypothetical protein